MYTWTASFYYSFTQHYNFFENGVSLLISACWYAHEADAVLLMFSSFIWPCLQPWFSQDILAWRLNACIKCYVAITIIAKVLLQNATQKHKNRTDYIKIKRKWERSGALRKVITVDIRIRLLKTTDVSLKFCWRISVLTKEATFRWF